MISLRKDHQGDLASWTTGRNFLKKEVHPRETDFYSHGSPSRQCLEEKITIRRRNGHQTAESSDESCYTGKSPVEIVTKQSWAVEVGSGSGGQRRRKHCRLLSPVFSLSQIIADHPQPTHYRGQLCGSSGGMRVLCRRGRGGGVDFRMLPACLNPPPLPHPPHPPLLLLRPPEGTSGSVGRPQGCRPPMCWTFSNATARLPVTRFIGAIPRLPVPIDL